MQAHSLTLLHVGQLLLVPTLWSVLFHSCMRISSLRPTGRRLFTKQAGQFLFKPISRLIHLTQHAGISFLTQHVGQFLFNHPCRSVPFLYKHAISSFLTQYAGQFLFNHPCRSLFNPTCRSALFYPSMPISSFLTQHAGQFSFNPPCRSVPL